MVGRIALQCGVGFLPSHLCVCARPSPPSWPLCPLSCRSIASLLASLPSLVQSSRLGARVLQQLRLLSVLHTLVYACQYCFIDPSHLLLPSNARFKAAFVLGPLEGGHQDEIRCVGDLVGGGNTSQETRGRTQRHLEEPSERDAGVSRLC